jgi:hypothetical protein
MYHQYLFFFIYINKLKWGRQVDSGDELYNVASNIECYQIHLAYVLFIFKICMPFYISNFSKVAYQ